MVYKKILVAAAMGAALLTVPAVAQDKVRTGTVVAMDPIENRGADETTSTKKKKGLGRMLGSIGGVALGTQIGGNVGMAAIVGGASAGEKIAEATDKPVSTQYMVKVKLDDGKTLNLSQYRVNLNGVAVGSRVSVSGKGGDARLAPIATMPVASTPIPAKQAATPKKK